MKILIAVPSKNRMETLEKFTYQWLKLLSFDWKIFVEPQDFEKYANVATNLISIEKDNQGFSYVKSFIKNYAEKNGYDLVFKVDDDIKCFTDFRKNTTPEKTAELLTEFINEKVMKGFENPLLGAISFPYSFEMFEKKEWTKSKRIQTCYICRTEYVQQPILGISVFEDFAVGIKILTDGKIILKYGLLGQNMGVKVGGGTGGHQDFDRNEQALKEVDLLRKIYPPLKFKKVSKAWSVEPDLRSVKL